VHGAKPRLGTHNDVVMKRVICISIQMFGWTYICFRTIRCIHVNDWDKTAQCKMLTDFFINAAKPVHLSYVHSPCFHQAILRNIKLYLKYHGVYFTRFACTDIKAKK